MATKWCVRVSYSSGGEAFLREGARAGHGRIVRFTSKRRAQSECDFIAQGLDAGDVAMVVPYDPEDEDE